MKNIEPSFSIQEEGMKDIEAPFPIQEQGDFIDINKNVNHKQDQEQEDAEPPCPPAENKTALPDSQVDLEGGKRWKRKKRKKRKKAPQTPSTFTKHECEWKDFFWKSFLILCVSTILVFGTAAIYMQERSVEEVPKIQAQRSVGPTYKSAGKVQERSVEEVPKIQAQRSAGPTYKSAGKEMCTATFKVDDPPIVLKMNENAKVLKTDVRCPNTEEYLKIKICFQNEFLVVSFKKGEDGPLYIEHGTGRDQSTYVDMKNEACYSSVEDQAETPTPKPDETEHEAKKGCPPSVKDCLETKRQNVNEVSNFSTKFTGAGGMNFFGGIGALILIGFPLAAFIFVVRYLRRVRRAVANTENGNVGGQV